MAQNQAKNAMAGVDAHGSGKTSNMSAADEEDAKRKLKQVQEQERLKDLEKLNELKKLKKVKVKKEKSANPKPEEKLDLTWLLLL